jgi:hypothetical protein
MERKLIKFQYEKEKYSMKSLKPIFVIMCVSILLLAACSSGGGGDVALKITGNVANDQAWTEEDVKTMDRLEVESTNKEGEVSTYTGVLLTDLLAEAQPNADAATIVFVADDGYTAEISLEELKTCDDCIVSFRNQGGFSTVLPEYSGKLQVKGLIEIQVK